MRVLWETVFKVNINKHPYSSLICPATFLIMEGYQIDIAELILEMKLQLPCMMELDTETWSNSLFPCMRGSHLTWLCIRTESSVTWKAVCTLTAELLLRKGVNYSLPAWGYNKRNALIWAFSFVQGFFVLAGAGLDKGCFSLWGRTEGNFQCRIYIQIKCLIKKSLITSVAPNFYLLLSPSFF